jgi:PKD repeat protein
MMSFKKITIVLALVCFFFGLITKEYHSQGTYHYVGTNNLQNTSSSFPSIYGNFFRGVKHQILVRAAELQSAGISAGNITGLAFDIVTTSGNLINGFEIEMKSTTQQSLSSWSNNNLATYFGPASYTDQVGWNQHNFSSPFFWDGTSNIVIQTCFYNNSWSSNAVMNMSNYGYNSLIYRRRDNSSPCNSNWINGVETQRPNIRFSWVDPSSPPITNFSTSGSNTCSGLVSFYDQTSNSPTGWLWNFGDGNSSSQQNPTHSYTSSGNYTVELVTSNSFGSDTITYSNLIQVNLTNTPPIAPSCTPTTGIAGTIGNYGITEFNFGNLSNTSGTSTEGYSDFTCDSSLFYIGQTYTLRATHISVIPQNFFAWIDFNNNGIFETATEQIVSNLVSGDSTSTTVSIPSFGVVNTPLRLRIMSDASFSGQLDPCTDPVYGQAEDYTIYLAYNFSPPDTDFESNINYSCDGIVEFSDLSSNIPYAWYWDFGDGNSSISQNPIHTYINNGIYDVTLISSNLYGDDSTTYSQYIEIDSTNLVISAGPNPNTVSYCCDYGISRVQFANVNNPSLDGIDGYVDYSCENQAFVEAGTNYALRVYTGPTNSQDTRAWIDYNNDGVFSTNEKVMEKINQFDPVSIVQIPSNIAVNTPIRLRISSDEVGNNNGPTGNVSRGQVEDYAIIVATCPDPSNIIIGQISNSSVELNWLAGGSEDSWNVRYGPEGFGIFSGLGVTVNNIFVNNFFVTGLDESTSYDFYVQSICTGNNSNWIGPFNSTTLNIIGNTNSQNVSVYPNPNNKIFSIQTSTNMKSIEVLDILGSHVRTFNPNTNLVEINISENKSGVYFLKISLINGNVVTKKIICK